jgi:hypothetical protein
MGGITGSLWALINKVIIIIYFSENILLSFGRLDY